MDLTDEIRSFRNELIAMRSEIREARKEIAELKSCLQFCSDRVDGLECRVSSLEQNLKERKPSKSSELDARIAELRNQLDERGKDLMLNDEIITGLLATKEESVGQVVKLVVQKLGLSLDDRDAVHVKRAGTVRRNCPSGKSEPKRPRSSAVRLARRSSDGARLRHGFFTGDLGQPGPALGNECLIRNNAQLFHSENEAGVRLQWKFVWKNESRILACKGEGINGRHVWEQKDKILGKHFPEDKADNEIVDNKYYYLREPYEPSLRIRRQADVSSIKNPDGSSDIDVKVRLSGEDDKQNINAISSITGAQGKNFETASAGLVYNTDKGNSLSIIGKHIPNYENQLTGAGKVNLLHNDHHNLDVNGFFTRTMPINPNAKNTNIAEAILDYTSDKGNSLKIIGKHNSYFGNELIGAGKVNLYHNDNNNLDFSALLSKTMPNNPFMPNTNKAEASLDYTSNKGSSLSITGRHMSDFGNEISGAGKVNIFHNDNHNLDANGFFARTMPNNPAMSNYNSYGGNLDYMYKDKAGASFDMKHTDLFDRTDYSAMGKFNLFKDRDTSFDFNAGVSKSVSPFISKSSWEPSFGLTFIKHF